MDPTSTGQTECVDTNADSTEKDDRAHRDPQGDSSSESSDDGFSSGYSSFEDEIDSGQPIAAALERNYELMKKRDEQQRTQFRYLNGHVVVYDSEARLVGYFASRSSIEAKHQQQSDPRQPMRILRRRPARFVSPSRPTSWKTSPSPPHAAGASCRCVVFSGVTEGIERVICKNVPAFLPSKSYPAEHTLAVPSFTEGVEFFSRFENANLRQVTRVSRVEYELYLGEDYGTTGHYHWFFFRTRSTLPAGTAVRFKIVNMIKPSSLYSVGFRPFAFSTQDWKRDTAGWLPAGDSVSYTPNVTPSEGRRFYTLEWRYVYRNSGDEVYFAQFPPYTYSDLLDSLREIKQCHATDNIVRIDTLCRTLAGNPCPVLTITENVGTYIEHKYEKRLAGKSKGTREMIWNRVDKLRTRLHLKRMAAKSRKSNKKKRRCSEEDVADSQSQPQRLSDTAEPEYSRDHELESTSLLPQNSRLAQTPGRSQGQKGRHHHGPRPSRYFSP